MSFFCTYQEERITSVYDMFLLLYLSSIFLQQLPAQHTPIHIVLKAPVFCWKFRIVLPLRRALDSRDSEVDVATTYIRKGPGMNLWRGKNFSLHQDHSDRLWDLHYLQLGGNWGYFSGVKRPRLLTIHVCLLQSWRKSEATTLLPLYAFMVYTETTLP